MPLATTGVTSATNSSIVVDAGAIYTNFGETNMALLGATSGGNSFVLETEYRHPELDGLKGFVTGMQRIVTVSAKMTVNLIEINDKSLLFALPGAAASDVIVNDTTGAITTGTPATHSQITRNRKILSTDYLKNVALVGEVQGKAKPIIIRLDNVLALGNLEMSFEDKGEVTIPVEFTAHFDPATFTQEPWRIIYPKS